MNKTATKLKKKPSNMIVQETAHIAESLPAEQAAALLDYAKYLAERAEEAEWDRRLGDRKYLPKLKAKLAEVKKKIAAGEFSPLDSTLL